MADAQFGEDIGIEKPSKDSFRILMVDDEPLARNLLRAILQQNGYQRIDEANSGMEALTALKNSEYHLVLLDKNMPGIDGIEVLRTGKKVRPDAEFIMITAFGSMETAIQAMDLGAFSYVTKPFSEIDVILSRIEGALALASTRLENKLLLERMRMLLRELESAQANLGELNQDPESNKEQTTDQLTKVSEAVLRLRVIAKRLAGLREKVQGKAADLFENMGKEVGDVADLLDQQGNGSETAIQEAENEPTGT